MRIKDKNIPIVLYNMDISSKKELIDSLRKFEEYIIPVEDIIRIIGSDCIMLPDKDDNGNRYWNPDQVRVAKDINNIIGEYMAQMIDWKRRPVKIIYQSFYDFEKIATDFFMSLYDIFNIQNKNPDKTTFTTLSAGINNVGDEIFLIGSKFVKVIDDVLYGGKYVSRRLFNEKEKRIVFAPDEEDESYSSPFLDIHITYINIRFMIKKLHTIISNVLNDIADMV